VSNPSSTKTNDTLEDYDDVSVYGIDEARRDILLKRHHECSVVWSTADGWPVGVMHIYIWHAGRFWVTCTGERKRVPALRARPRSSIIAAFDGEQTVTAKTIATVHDHGSEHHGWFYEALAEKVLPGQPAAIREAGTEAWIERLDSPGRVVIEFTPKKWISFDGRKVVAHAGGHWQPGTPWHEPSG
jgi:hypothetical protein